MISKDVILFYNQLKQIDIQIWIDGGWGVDALMSVRLLKCATKTITRILLKLIKIRR